MSRRELVQRGYDTVAERYRELVARTEGDPRLRFLDDLAGRLPDGAAVLDLYGPACPVALGVEVGRTSQPPTGTGHPHPN